MAKTRNGGRPRSPEKSDGRPLTLTPSPQPLARILISTRAFPRTSSRNCAREPYRPHRSANPWARSSRRAGAIPGLSQRPSRGLVVLPGLYPGGCTAKRGCWLAEWPRHSVSSGPLSLRGIYDGARWRWGSPAMKALCLAYLTRRSSATCITPQGSRVATRPPLTVRSRLPGRRCLPRARHDAMTACRILSSRARPWSATGVSASHSSMICSIVSFSTACDGEA